MELVEYSFEFSKQQWIASTERTLFHVHTGALIISDLHIGKATHFSKNHAQLPNDIEIAELVRLGALLKKYNPTQLILLGDIFHSSFNSAWNNFSKLLKESPIQRKILVKGNHDILDFDLYEKAELEIVDLYENETGIQFVHDAADASLAVPIISGHIHPGVVLKGKARQMAMLPCFHIQPQHLLMPAFGKLTGLKSVNKVTEDDRFLAFTKNKFWEI